MKPPVTFNEDSPFYLKDMKWVFVDLDETIYKSKGPEFKLAELKEGVKDALYEIVKRGYKIRIFTSRHESEYYYIEHCLKRDKIPFKEIRCGKPMGIIYIDDRGFRLKDWRKDAKKILEILK